jgi:putative ABC transport system ATP-binding protein
VTQIPAVHTAAELPGASAAGPVVAFGHARFAWAGRNAFALEVKHFTLAAGERVLLLGPSGSGKSTFLSLLAGIVVAQSGHVRILGSDLAAFSGAARDHFRAEHFGIIFQMFNLLPYGSVIDNVMLPLRFSAKRRERTRAEGGEVASARRLLEALELDPEVFSHASASNLSVGQQQRVAAARALIGAPQIIVADEPTSALDRNLQGAFLELLSAEIARAKSSLIMVSHDETLGSRFDRVVRLTDIASTTSGGAR